MFDMRELDGVMGNYPTPFYLFDLDAFRERFEAIQQIVGDDVTLVYAMKANPFLVHTVTGFSRAKFEVCSPGEFSICERDRVPMASIVLSGVYKEREDLEHVMDACGGVGMYTVESIGQFLLLNDMAAERRIQIPVLLRLTGGNQFGIDEDAIREIVSHRDAYKNIRICGIQQYTGTQKRKFEDIASELDKLDEFCDSLKEDYGFTVQEIEYGPGLKVEYFGDEAYRNDLSGCQMLADKLASFHGKYHFSLEIGRYLAALCGMYVTRIVDMKVNRDEQYLIVDGGINHLNYYGQAFGMHMPPVTYIPQGGEGVGLRQGKGRVSSYEKHFEWTVCGALCTTSDVLLKRALIKDPHIGDTFVFFETGAYSVTEAMYLFLSRKLPRILAYSAGKLEVYRGIIGSDVINSRKGLVRML